MDKIKKEISIPSILVFLSYVTYVFYKFGESIYFGYPINLIWTDINTLIISLLQSSIILLAFFMVISVSIQRNTTIAQNMTIISGGIIGATILRYESILDDIPDLILTLIIFFLLFSLSRCLKKLIPYESNKLLSKWGILSFLLLCLLSFFTGNCFAPIKNLIIDSDNNMIVGDFKDSVIKISCTPRGEKKVTISKLENEEIKSVPNTLLKRDWLVGHCINNNTK
ncbi:hypothetical protein KKJ04_21120 [Xenorhabdus bovienii]|uniref:hypothetical protein n=1 Tax=Xenorhabdus bovienii TaxID=40576 RepID=UPI0023B2DA72|nr:hypothetical protein [Xenorhabdus bovienii]MDE9447960.1 hypothetical protein [Xenorhabdus bovienii]